MKTLWDKIPWTQILEKEKAFFIYDLAELKKRVLLIRVRFQGIPLFYSVKSNPNRSLLVFLDSLVDGFDVSSEGELSFLLAMGISPDRITFSGPGKTDSALRLATEKKIHALHIDSLSELKTLQSLKSKIPWTLRLAGPQPIAAKLGFTIEELHGILRQLPAGSLAGLHCYLGRESFQQELFTETLETFQNFFSTYATVFQSSPRAFVGPGLPSSFSEESPLTVRTGTLALSLELGRALVGPAGFYGAPVLSHKTVDSGRHLILMEGGLQHLGSPLQSYRDQNRSLQLWVLRDGQILKESFELTASIYGSLCLWHDCLVPNMKVPSSLRRGDWLLFSEAGAYGLTAGVPYFIGQSLPTEWGADADGHITDFTNHQFKTYLEGTIP